MKAYKLITAIALGGLMACGPIAKAQTSTPPVSGETTHPRGGRGPNFQVIFDQLNLTDDQKAKVKTQMDDTHQKMTALRDDTSLSRDDRRAKMKDIRDANDAKLKEILTPDQYTKYQELMKQQMNRSRRGAGGGNPPAPSGNQ